MKKYAPSIPVSTSTENMNVMDIEEEIKRRAMLNSGSHIKRKRPKKK